MIYKNECCCATNIKSRDISDHPNSATVYKRYHILLCCAWEEIFYCHVMDAWGEAYPQCNTSSYFDFKIKCITYKISTFCVDISQISQLGGLTCLPNLVVSAQVCNSGLHFDCSIVLTSMAICFISFCVMPFILKLK